MIQKKQITEAAKIKITNSIKNINWEYLEALDVNEAYIAFSNTINNIINTEAPVKTIIIPASKM